MLASKRIHAGSGPPLWVVTSTGAVLPAVSCTCAGSGKEKPVPEVAVSLGTETVTMPESLAEGGRTSDTEMPAPAPPPSAFDELLPGVVPPVAVPPDAGASPDGVVVEPPELVLVAPDDAVPALDGVDVPLADKSPPGEPAPTGAPPEEPLPAKAKPPEELGAAPPEDDRPPDELRPPEELKPLEELSPPDDDGCGKGGVGGVGGGGGVGALPELLLEDEPELEPLPVELPPEDDDPPLEELEPPEDDDPPLEELEPPEDPPPDDEDDPPPDDEDDAVMVPVPLAPVRV